ncbi:hypothetical protein AAF712_010480 [Marasmius tenuissimus]|uniref:JmjC domain-containing protein n=1 Tax=Marasmius tenuissimus TaxID=585030 RepID=A0ABR2ZPI3_9AGAR
MEGTDRKTAISQLLNPHPQSPGTSIAVPHPGHRAQHHQQQYPPSRYQRSNDSIWAYQHNPYHPYAQNSHIYPEPNTSTPLTTASTSTMSATCQASSRASVRIVARSTTALGEDQYWAASSSSGGTRDPYSSEYSQPQPPPQVYHEQPAGPKRKRNTPQSDNNGDAVSVEGENVVKKSKKASSTAGGSRPPNSSSSASKRGYNAKKRSEAAQVVAAATMSTPTVSYSPNGSGKNSLEIGTPVARLNTEVQSARCMSSKYKKEEFPRCVSCTRRWAGDTCRFQGVRLFMKDSKGETVGVAFVNHQREEAPVMQFPEEWNEKLGWDIIRRTKVKNLTKRPDGMTEKERIEQKKEKDRQMHSSPFFLTCTKRNEHKADDFTPVSRFCKKELESAIAEMEATISHLDDHDRDKAASVPSHSYPLSPPLPSPPPPTTSLYFPQNPMSSKADQIPAHRIDRFTKESLSFAVFQDHWRKGIPLMVEGLSSSFQIQWTPEYFIEKYGNQTCIVIECQKEDNKRVTVGQFFKTFQPGDDGTLGPGNWKLKDWPPSTDFKTAFPELYEDFSQVVPIPQYVRRDGVMNISSHFPQNTVAPDLGPKMYNAMTANEEPGSKGSTRLHMDMADALNIMTYASPFSPPTSGETPTSPSPMEPGCAAWDLFRAEDANKLRDFLRRKFPGQLPHDPIHSQQVYLDRELRRQLYDEEGVMSYRLYQRPGEAVFIPAGVAHQVCNLSNCIKVAIDFVSPENVERCEQLTREFREQNNIKAWKEDVLQLKSMLWFAWMSCRRQEEKLRRMHGESGSGEEHGTQGVDRLPPRWRAPSEDIRNGER